MLVKVTIPGLLRDCAGGRTTFTIDANTIAQALQVIQRDYPLLRVHVWDDLGELRQHVLIFHNDTALRWLPSLDAPLKEGDRLQIVQAISGGYL
jgi:molybdopterin converting factor small subunit